MSSIGQDGSPTCVATGGGGQGVVVAPKVFQVSSIAEPVLINRNGIELVGECSPVAAAIVVRYVSGSGLNVVSDSRRLHRGQTLSSGELAIGGGISADAIDRGDFDIVNAANGEVLNGTFYAVLNTGPPVTCQFDVSGFSSS